MKKSLPPVKLLLTPSGFDFLMTVLNDNSINFEKLELEEYRNDAEKLMETLMKYSRIITDDETKEQYIRILMYPNEASEMIWELLFFMRITTYHTLHQVLFKIFSFVDIAKNTINDLLDDTSDILHFAETDEDEKTYSEILMDNMTTNELPKDE